MLNIVLFLVLWYNFKNTFTGDIMLLLELDMIKIRWLLLISSIISGNYFECSLTLLFGSVCFWGFEYIFTVQLVFLLTHWDTQCFDDTITMFLWFKCDHCWTSFSWNIAGSNRTRWRWRAAGDRLHTSSISTVRQPSTFTFTFSDSIWETVSHGKKENYCLTSLLSKRFAVPRILWPVVNAFH